MFGVADYGSFVAAIVIFLAIPGPGNLALITSTSKGGIAGGLAATLGIIAGDQVLMWLAVAGVAALLAAYPAAFHGVQWLGAGYLAWLGLRRIARPGQQQPQARSQIDRGGCLAHSALLIGDTEDFGHAYLASASLTPKPMRNAPANFPSARPIIGLARKRSAR